MNKDINKQIEGLRGISVSVIVFYHLVIRFGELYMDAERIPYLSNLGIVGSTMFLIISGCFMINSGNHFNLVKFFKNKIVRLMPAYLLAITITFIVTHIWHLPERTCTFWEYLCNVFCLNGFFDIPYVDGAHWYLTTLISAIVCTGIFRYFRIEKMPWTYLGWMIIALAVRGAESFIYPAVMHFFYRLIGGQYISIICFGIGLRLYWDEKQRRFANQIPVFLMILTALAYMFFSFGSKRIWIALIEGLVLLACLDKRARLLEWRPLVALGAVSYPLYLCHQNIGYVVEYNLSDYFGKFSFVSTLTALIIISLITVCIDRASKEIQRSIR